MTRPTTEQALFAKMNEAEEPVPANLLDRLELALTTPEMDHLLAVAITLVGMLFLCLLGMSVL